MSCLKCNLVELTNNLISFLDNKSFGISFNFLSISKLKQVIAIQIQFYHGDEDFLIIYQSKN